MRQLDEQFGEELLKESDGEEINNADDFPRPSDIWAKTKTEDKLLLKGTQEDFTKFSRRFFSKTNNISTLSETISKLFRIETDENEEDKSIKDPVKSTYKEVIT